ncbi:MAG: EamA family transporter RarD [Gemmataceae bacterium]|nr:EamA family transporter RarD [Gemmataceae bacterium]MCI0739544.1 EamA family transporter RarD [Gemmataceae bacterium]
MTSKAREGLVYGLIAYGWWGLVPLYFRLLGDVAPTEILAHRIVWSMLFLVAALTRLRRWRAFAKCFRVPVLFRVLALTSVLIAVNWFVYIFAVDRGLVVHASLGYFITPLVSVALGMFFLEERLRPLQWLALVFALAGTSVLVLSEDQFPWIALSLACSFSLYGLFRKKIPVDGLVGLSVETLLLVPLAAAYLVFLGWHGESAFGAHSFAVDLLLLASGVVTAVPLLCFGQATQRLPLSTLGFLQYLSPSIQFLLAVTVLGEYLNTPRLVSFPLIWCGLAVFTLDSLRNYQRRVKSAAAVAIPNEER